MQGDERSIEFEGGRLTCGDCTDVLGAFAEGTVDLMITSPPYFMGKDYDRSMSIDDFRTAVAEVQKKVYPLIKDGGSICWQVGSHVTGNTVIPLDYMVYDIVGGFPDLTLRNRIVWTFEHGINSSNRFSGRHETVLWFTKGAEYIFNLDDVRVPQKYPGKTFYKGPRKGQLSGNPMGKNPGDVWDIPNVKANHVEKTEHPCQFPVALAARLIKAMTHEGALVLDPFAGAGSTAIAALETNRRFACIEREPQYMAVAEARIRAWYDGSLRVRDDVPPILPDPRTKVASRPSHFLGAET